MTEHLSPQYFDKIDSDSTENDYFRPVMNEFISSLDCKQASILDVGCGTGISMIPLVEAGCKNLYGVDGPHDYIKRAVDRGYKKTDIVNDLNYDQLPYENQMFDAVVTKDVFEHLLSPTFALREIARVLKPNGLLLFHVPNHFPLLGRIKFLVNNNIDTFSFFEDESRWSFPHIRFYEHTDSLKVFTAHDFELVKNLCHHFVVDVPFVSQISFLVKTLRKMAHNYPNQFAQGYTYLLQKTNVTENKNV